jgi:hypothetical protein
MKTVARPVAMVWSLSGDDADVAKAKTFAAANGYTVLTFPTTEQDPIGRAKHQITDRRVRLLKIPIIGLAGLWV